MHRVREPIVYKIYTTEVSVKNVNTPKVETFPDLQNISVILLFTYEKLSPAEEVKSFLPRCDKLVGAA